MTVDPLQSAAPPSRPANDESLARLRAEML
jgi:hypothetical protein